jgi:hypothetical protein
VDGSDSLLLGTRARRVFASPAVGGSCLLVTFWPLCNESRPIRPRRVGTTCGGPFSARGPVTLSHPQTMPAGLLHLELCFVKKAGFECASRSALRSSSSVLATSCRSTGLPSVRNNERRILPALLPIRFFADTDSFLVNRFRGPHAINLDVRTRDGPLVVPAQQPIGSLDLSSTCKDTSFSPTPSH